MDFLNVKQSYRAPGKITSHSLHEIANKVKRAQEAIQKAFHAKIEESELLQLRDTKLSNILQRYGKLREKRERLQREIEPLASQEERSETEEGQLASLQEQMQSLEEEMRPLDTELKSREKNLEKLFEFLKNFIEKVNRAISLILQNVR